MIKHFPFWNVLMIMRPQFGTIILGIALFFCGSSYCQEPALMKTVRQLYNNTTPLETGFDLKILWKVREKEESKSGSLFLAPGDKFRVELGKSTWVCDGKTYWEATKEDEKVNVIIKRFSDVDFSMHPSHLLYTYLENFTYQFKAVKGPLTMVSWKTDSASKIVDIESVDLAIDSKSGTIKTLRIIDKSGNESFYQFKKTKIPAKLPESTFSYIAPKGASTLDMRN